MKKAIRSFITIALIVVPLFIIAQPHPNGGSTPSGGNTPVGGSSPIGGGLLIMLSLAIGYGARKVYDVRKREL